MRLITKLTDLTLTSKFIKTLSYGIDYIKDYHYVSDTLYSEAFAKVLKKYLRVNIKKDWIGRLYGIINPSINDEGKLDLTNTIYEFNDEYTNSTDYVQTWVFKQMNLISTLFKIEKLYDYISCDIKKVDKYDNFLIIFDITSRKDFASVFKKFIIQLFIYAIIAVILFFILK